MSGFISLVLFCVLDVFHAALLHTMHPARRLQFQLTRFWHFGKRVGLSASNTAGDAFTSWPRADVLNKVKKQSFLPCGFIFKRLRWLVISTKYSRSNSQFYHTKEVFPQVARVYFQKIMNSLFWDDTKQLIRNLYQKNR